MLKKIYPLTKTILSQGQSISLFFARIAVAYGFYEPAMTEMVRHRISRTMVWIHRYPFSYT